MKNKGFTLVEILAVIVILGIIATIAIASVTRIIGQSKERYYEKQEDLLIIAGKNYYEDYRSKLPYEIGTIGSVDVSTLVEQKYIEPVVDVNKNACSSDTSKVYVQKVTEEEYKYWGYLDCGRDEYISSTDTEKPNISFSPNSTIGTSTSEVKVIMSVTDNEKVASYRYVITKDKVEYKDSGYKTYDKEVAITLTNNGIYTIKGYAYDTSGNKVEKNSGTYTINITEPNCNGITLTASETKSTWVNRDIVVTFTKGNGVNYYTAATNENDKGYKNKIKNSTKTRDIKLTTEGKTKVRVKGYNSESISCQKDIPEYFLDKTKPTTPVITNPTGGNWVNYTFSLTVKSNDPKPSSGGEQSGLAYYQYSYDNSSWTTYASSAKDSFTTTPFSVERNQYVYIRSCDNAGNCSDSAKTMIRIDKTKPSCSTAKSNLNTMSGVTVNISCWDNGTYQSSIKNCPSRRTGVKNSQTYTVTDKANNSNTCSVQVTPYLMYARSFCTSCSRCSNSACEVTDWYYQYAYSGDTSSSKGYYYGCRSHQYVHFLDNYYRYTTSCYTEKDKNGKKGYYETYDVYQRIYYCKVYTKNCDACGCDSWSGYSGYVYSSCGSNSSTRCISTYFYK